MAWAAAAASRGSPASVLTDETVPSSATWTSRVTSPERCAARASAGYCGSVRVTRRLSACAGASQTACDWVLGAAAGVVDAADGEEGTVSAEFCARILSWEGEVVCPATTTGFMRNTTLPWL